MQDQFEFYENNLAHEMDPSELWDALEYNERVIALDTRQAFSYENEHIPTAINISHREMNEESIQHLDKTKTYVCFCDGIGRNASAKGALNMTKLGFKVKELKGGVAWWEFDGYATSGTQTSEGEQMQCAC